MSMFTAGLCAFAALAFVALRAQQAPPSGRGPAPVASVPKPPQMASVDPLLFRGMKFRLLGPSRGGRVTAVTGVPSQPATFYMGVASGGLFKTTDSGVTWTPISDGKIPVGSMGAIAVADSDPNVIYVGTGSDGVRSNVSTGRGVYKSTDAGATWKFSGLYDSGQIGAVRIHPTNPNIVWISATGDIFKANAERGIFKTTDGGATWKKVLYLNDTVGAMDVELQPGNPNVVYAWMSRLERKPWTIISGGKEGGFYKSTDGGETFTKTGTGLPNQLIGKANMAVTAANPSRIYALVEALPGGGMYRSDDAGATWGALPSPAAMIYRPFYYTTIGADPSNADVVFGGAEGFWKSTDAGKTWAAMRTPHGDNHDIWINPKNSNIMIQSNDGGANVSTDGGRTWSTQMNQVTSEIYGVWMDNEFPYNVYGAQQDNSTLIITSQANPFDTSDFRGGPGCETGPIMPHPKDPNIVYGSCKGQYEWMNLKTGQSKRYWVGAQSLYGNSGKDLILRFQRVSPMNTSPFDPDVLYYGSQYLHRTRDKGVTWEKMSPDLTEFDPCCQDASGTPITRDVTGEEFYSTLYAITESPIERGVIWTGSNDGPFYVTRDNGKIWTKITPKDLPPGGRVAWIDASPHRRGSAYFAVYRYLLGDYAPYIYKTDDYGKTWTKLTDGKNGIAADNPTRVVREDPDRAGLLYAGTEFGMFISFDNGGHWQNFNLNVPIVPINDIKIHKKDLVVATQGRALWVFDNLTALHQMAPAVTPMNPYLFKPRDGYKTRTNPELLGPMIEYYLPAAPAGPVVVEILDAKGAAVNRYTSDAPAGGGRGGGRGGRAGGAGAGGGGDDPEAAMAEGRPGRGGGSGAPLAIVTKNPGMNRFVWDVRHSNGLGAPPAAYEARVTVDGKTLTTKFNVLVDPNLAAEGLTAADLVEQFNHNVKVRELTAATNAAVARARDLLSTHKNDPVRLKQVEEIASTLLTQPVRYGKPGLQAHVQYLAGMTSAVDQKVGRDALERYAVLKKELDSLIAVLDKIK
ncbi:MAG TPA: hypothetical protein VN700_17140 [Vicinamibacterales bacterium]|nr:hypothetical protein [Vicinamibacterales bacterium]